MPLPAKRLQQLPPYIFSVISDRLRQMSAEGIDVIRLDIGNPDMPPPDVVVEALERSAYQPTHHGYTDYRGTPDFRRAVADHYQRMFGVTVNPDTEVLPLLGSKEGIVNLSIAYLGDGDVSLIPDVGYPAYSMGARLAGGTIQYVPITEANDYLPDLDQIPSDAAHNAKLLWVNYPNNPSGAVAPLSFYQRTVEYCRHHDILLVSDNPYVDIVYDGQPPLSALQADGAKETTIEFVSFSKSYNMAGWRLGAAVGNADAIKTLLKVKSNVDSGHFKPVYDAGITALTQTSEEWIVHRNDVYCARRDRVLAALPQIGLQAQPPKGSIYVWAKLLQGNMPNGDAPEYVERALREAHVCLAPGEAYGPGGKGYVRFSLAVEDQQLDAALERLKRWYSNAS